MSEDFPGDYCPFEVDAVLLIEWFSVVQLLGKSRKLYSHASLEQFWKPRLPLVWRERLR